MTKSLRTTTEQLDARLHEQALEVAALLLALDIQSSRIADARAARDVPPLASERRTLPGAPTQAGNLRFLRRTGALHARRRTC